jgi:integrase
VINLGTELRKTEETTSRRMLTNTEVKLLLEGLQGKNRVIVLISLFTGMKLKDILSLRWDDIDLRNALMTYSASETGRKVVIPLTDLLVDVLSRYKREYITGTSLFHAGEITRDVQVKYRNHFKRLFKELGIMNFGFHQLRHSSAVLITNVSSKYHDSVSRKPNVMSLLNQSTEEDVVMVCNK